MGPNNQWAVESEEADPWAVDSEEDERQAKAKADAQIQQAARGGIDRNAPALGQAPPFNPLGTPPPAKQTVDEQQAQRFTPNPSRFVPRPPVAQPKTLGDQLLNQRLPTATDVVPGGPVKLQQPATPRDVADQTPVSTDAGMIKSPMIVDPTGESLGQSVKNVAQPVKDYATGAKQLKDGAVQLGESWGDDFSFNSTDAKQGLHNLIGGLMETTIPLAAAEFGQNPVAARALAAGILGGYVTGQAARKGAQVLGLDPDSQNLADDLGNLAGGIFTGALAHTAGTHGEKAGPGHPDIHPDYQLGEWDVKDEEPVPETEEDKPEPKPAAKAEEVTHPSGEVTGIEQKSGLPIVDTDKPSAEEKAEPTKKATSTPKTAAKVEEPAEKPAKTEEEPTKPTPTLKVKGEELPPQTGTAGKMSPEAEETSAKAEAEAKAKEKPGAYRANSEASRGRTAEANLEGATTHSVTAADERHSPVVQLSHDAMSLLEKHGEVERAKSFYAPKVQADKIAAFFRAAGKTEVADAIDANRTASGGAIISRPDLARDVHLEEHWHHWEHYNADLHHAGVEAALAQYPEEMKAAGEQLDEDYDADDWDEVFAKMKSGAQTFPDQDKLLSAYFDAVLKHPQGGGGVFRSMPDLDPDTLAAVRKINPMMNRVKVGEEANETAGKAGVSKGGSRDEGVHRQGAEGQEHEGGAGSATEEGHPEEVGEVDPESGRVITQPTDKLAAAQRLATAAAPELDEALRKLLEDVPGAKLNGIRYAKDPERAAEKTEEQDQPVETISDLLASRIEVDSRAAKDAVVDKLRKAFTVIKEDDHFEKGDPEYGFRSHDLQVKMPNGSSAEIQVIPREIAQALKETHKTYEQGRTAELEGRKAEAEAAKAANRKIHDAAMDRFNLRNKLAATKAGTKAEVKPQPTLFSGSSTGKEGAKPEAAPTEASKTSQPAETSQPVKTSQPLSAPDTKSPLVKGQHVVLPDGRSATVGFHDAKFSNKVRVTDEHGTKSEVARKDLEPVRVQKQDPTAPWVGFDLDKTLAKFNQFHGDLDIGAPIDGPGTAMEALRNHLANGDNVRIVSARVAKDPYGKVARSIQAWLQKHVGQAVPVTASKDDFMTRLYDDKAIPVEPNTGRIIGDTSHVEDSSAGGLPQRKEEATPTATPADRAAGTADRGTNAAPAEHGTDAAAAAQPERAAEPEEEKNKQELLRPADAVDPPIVSRNHVAEMLKGSGLSDQTRDALGRFDVRVSKMVKMLKGDLKLAPKQLQYKLNADARGVTNLVRKYDEFQAGVIVAWYDALGELSSAKDMYVLNGHNRHGWAMSDDDVKYETVAFAEHAKTAAEARTVGAIMNIRDEKGTAVDAAKLLRETKSTPEELGIEISGLVAGKGAALARLNDRLFDQVVSGRMREGRGVAIGNATGVSEHQEAILELVRQSEMTGKHVPDEVIAEMGRLATRPGMEENDVQNSLFGLQEMKRSLLLQHAELTKYVSKAISEEKRLFSNVSDENKAERLGKKGNIIEAAVNAQVAKEAAQAGEVFARLTAGGTKAGEINDILERSAKALAKGIDPNKVKSDAYEQIRAALSAAISRIEGTGEGGREGSESGNTGGTKLARDPKGPLPGDQPLPGFENALDEKSRAEEEERGRELAGRLNSPKGDIEKAAGKMERDSPLFQGKGPQGNLFNESRLRIGNHRMHPGHDPQFEHDRLRNAASERTLGELEDWVDAEVEGGKHEDAAFEKTEKPKGSALLPNGKPDARERVERQAKAIASPPHINADNSVVKLHTFKDSRFDPVVELNAAAHGLLHQAGVIQVSGWDGLTQYVADDAGELLDKFLDDPKNHFTGSQRKNVLTLKTAVENAVTKYGSLILLDENGHQLALPEEQGHAWDNRNRITDSAKVTSAIVTHPFIKAVGQMMHDMGYELGDPGVVASEAIAKAISGQFEALGIPATVVHQFLVDAFGKIAEVRGVGPLNDIPSDRGVVQSAARIAKERWEANQNAQRARDAGTGIQPNGAGGPGASRSHGLVQSASLLQGIGNVTGRLKAWATDADTPGDRQERLMRETRGQMDRQLARVAEALKPYRSEWATRSHADFVGFHDYETTGKTANPKDQTLADFFHAAYAPVIRDIQSLKPGAMQNLKENYMAHWWKNPSLSARTIMQVLSGKRPFAGRAEFLKERTIPTTADGLAMGLQPDGWNPVDHFLKKYSSMVHFTMGYKTLEMMKGLGTAKFVRTLTKPPVGWTQLDDRIGTVISREANGDMVIRGRYYAPQDAARVFNNYVSRGFSGNGVLGPEVGAIADSLSWVNNNMNAVQLGLSAFHGVMTGLLSPVNDIALGVRQIREGKPLKGLGNIGVGLSTAGSIARTAIGGHMMLREYLSPGTYASVAKEANAVAQAGGRAYMRNGLELKPFTRMTNAIRNRAIAEGASLVIPTILHTAVAPVLDFWVPRMKLGAFYQLAHDTLEEGMRKGWNHDQFSKQLDLDWNSVDNRLGQIVHENMFMNRAVSEALQGTIRSVGWTGGSLREGAGAITDTLREGGKVFQGKIPDITNRMAFAIALPFYFGVMGAALTYYWNGRAPKDWKDLYYPEHNGVRIAPPGYMKDYIGFAMNPEQTALNKLSPLLEATGELLQNRDFHGTEIYHKDDPFWTKQIPQMARWAVGVQTPFSASGTQRMLEEKGEDASMTWRHPLDSVKKIAGAIARHPSDMALGFAGFQPAPAYIQNSKALNLAREYGRINRPPGTKTQQQTNRQNAMHAIETMYRRMDENGGQDTGLNDAINRYTDSGVLSAQDVYDAETRSLEDPLKAAIRSGGLSIEQVFNVYRAATPEEKDLIIGEVEAKAAEIYAVTDDEQREALEKSYEMLLGR